MACSVQTALFYSQHSMNKLTIKKCPICGATSLEHALTCVDHYATGEEFQLFRCSECGFLFTQSFPVEAEIGRYYETPDYISHSDTRKGMMNRIYHWVRTYMLGHKAKLVVRESHRTVGHLLDIGTGTGYFAQVMRERGWQVEAVEKNEGARNFAQAHFRLEVKPESALQAYPAASFDVVTLWHVMEHLEHLDETWELLQKLLAEKGILIVAVPNSSSYDAKKYGADWAAYDVPRHLWHFTPDSIERLAVKHGFVLSEHYPMPFDAFYIAMLTEKQLGKSWAFCRGMWTGTLAWFSSFIHKERSSSMIYVFRKK